MAEHRRLSRRCDSEFSLFSPTCLPRPQSARLACLLNPAKHLSPDLAMLPGAGVAIAVEEDSRRECPERRDARVGHHDHRGVANPLHGHHNRDRRAEAADASVEPPFGVANLLDTLDRIAVGPCAWLTIAKSEIAHKRGTTHLFDKRTFKLVQRFRCDHLSDAEPSRNPAGPEHQEEYDDRQSDLERGFQIAHARILSYLLASLQRRKP